MKSLRDRSTDRRSRRGEPGRASRGPLHHGAAAGLASLWCLFLLLALQSLGIGAVSSTHHHVDDRGHGHTHHHLHDGAHNHPASDRVATPYAPDGAPHLEPAPDRDRFIDSSAALRSVAPATPLPPVAWIRSGAAPVPASRPVASPPRDLSLARGPPSLPARPVSS